MYSFDTLTNNIGLILVIKTFSFYLQQFIFIRRSLIRYYKALNVILALMKTGAGAVLGGAFGF